MERNTRKLQNQIKALSKIVQRVALVKSAEELEKQVDGLTETMRRGEIVYERIRKQDPNHPIIQKYLKMTRTLEKTLMKQAKKYQRRKEIEYDEIEILTTDENGLEQVQVLKTIHHTEEDFDLEEEKEIDQLLQDAQDFVVVNAELSGLISKQGKKIEKIVIKAEKATHNVTKSAENVKKAHDHSTRNIFLIGTGVGTIIGAPVGLAALSVAPMIVVPAAIAATGLVGGGLGGVTGLATKFVMDKTSGRHLSVKRQPKQE